MSLIFIINKVEQMKESKKSLTGIDPINCITEQRPARELKCVLNASSHVKHYIHDWAKNTGLDQGIDDVNL